MADDQADSVAPDDEEEPSLDRGEQDNSTRLSNGRFAPGHSGNGKGRPPKRAPSVAEDLKRILAGKTPSKNPAFANLSLREGLLLSMCLQGLQNYRAALAVFSLEATTQGAAGGDGASGEGETCDDALSRYVERELRRRKLEASGPEIGDDDGEGSS